MPRCLIKYIIALIFLVVTGLLLINGRKEDLTNLGQGQKLNSAPQSQANGNQLWLADWRTRFETDSLYLYAVKLFGPPIDYQGKVTAIYDDEKFGTLVYSFKNNNQLMVEISPPESSRIRLRAHQGFLDESRALTELKQYIQNTRIEINWSKMSERIENGIRYETYECPEEGYNAAANIGYKNNKLVELEFHMAL